MNILSQETQMEDIPVQRRGSRAYQIFPETSLNEESDYPEDFIYRRERLPSIVVEPTEYSEQESGDMRWPPQCPTTNDAGKHDENHTETFVDGKHQEEMDKGLIIRKSSIGPSQSQLSPFHLTPPASPTAPEDAPPCLRS